LVPGRRTFGRSMGWRFEGGPDTRHSPETSTKGRCSIGVPAGVEKVSSEDSIAAASSLVRWGGSASLLGGLFTPFVWGLLPPLHSPDDGDRSGVRRQGRNLSSEAGSTDQGPHQPVG
jgi:hypothetical protein